MDAYTMKPQHPLLDCVHMYELAVHELDMQ